MNRLILGILFTLSASTAFGTNDNFSAQIACYKALVETSNTPVNTRSVNGLGPQDIIMLPDPKSRESWYFYTGDTCYKGTFNLAQKDDQGNPLDFNPYSCKFPGKGKFRLLFTNPKDSDSNLIAMPWSKPTWEHGVKDQTLKLYETLGIPSRKLLADDLGARIESVFKHFNDHDPSQTEFEVESLKKQSIAALKTCALIPELAAKAESEIAKFPVHGPSTTTGPEVVPATN